MALEFDVYANLLSDRLAVLGGVALGTVRTAATHSMLAEHPGDLAAGDAHVLALVGRVAHYATAVWNATAHAADVGEADTAAVYTDIPRGVDKRLQLLETHLYQ